jgi:hypothetical protein
MFSSRIDGQALGAAALQNDNDDLTLGHPFYSRCTASNSVALITEKIPKPREFRNDLSRYDGTN